VAGESGQRIAVFGKSRVHEPATLGRRKHGRDEEELRLGHVRSYAPQKTRHVHSVLARIGIGGVVHAERDDDEIGMYGGDSFRIPKRISGRPPTGSEVVELKLRAAALL